MLIIVPSSETKRVPVTGDPVDLAALSFPALDPVRRRVLAALAVTSGAPDALVRLQVGPSFAAEVARNTALLAASAAPALAVYAGTLHEGLAAATLSPEALSRAEGRLVVASSLWGLLRPMDRIPPYRLDICSRLVGLDALEPTWRTVIPATLAAAAGPDGVIVDLRSGSYQSMGLPSGAVDRTVAIRVEGPAGRVGNVIVKRVRGQVARHLLESGAAPATPPELAACIADAWPVRLLAPARPSRPWTLTVVAER